MTNRFRAPIELMTVTDGVAFPWQGMCVRLYAPADEQRFSPRGDFAQHLALEAGRLPDGPKWTLWVKGSPRAVGGFETLGVNEWGGWILAADLRPREWWLLARFTRAACAFADRLGTRVLALAAEGPAARMLEQSGFRHTSGETFIWRP